MLNRLKILTFALLSMMFITASSFALNVVELTPQYFPNPESSRALSNGKIYVGKVDLDPVIPANQKQISVLQESGATVEVSQPISTSSGGVPIYNGSPVTILVDGDYSLKVVTSSEAQVYYVPAVITGDTTRLSYYGCSVTAAVSAILTSQMTLYVDCNPIDLTANLTIPENITLVWDRGFTIGGSYTLTINKQIEAGHYRLFESSVTVALGEFAGVANAAWWGDGTDIGASVNAAYAASAGTVILQPGTLPLFTKITRPDEGNLRGQGQFVTEIMKKADVVAIEIENGYGSIADLSINSDGSDTTNGTGILVTNGPRDNINNVTVQNCGGDGIKHVKGNLTKYGKITTALNGGHGFYSVGVDPDTNGCRIEFLDSRSNTGDGLRLEDPWSESWTITAFCQSNGAYGAFFNTVNSEIVIYSETNGGTQTELGPNSQGNRVKSLLSTVVDNGTKNMLFADLNAKGSQGIHSACVKKLEITDGVTPGSWVTEVTGASLAHMTSSGSSNSTLTYEHTQDPTYKFGMRIKGPIFPENITIEAIQTFADDAAAGAGGLGSGEVYQTVTGELRIKL